MAESRQIAEALEDAGIPQEAIEEFLVEVDAR